MWVLLEGAPSPVNLKVNALTLSQTLDDFRAILKKDFEELRNVRPQNIVFLDNNNTPIPPNSGLQNLAKTITVKKPLVIRYPLSDLSIKVNFKLTINKGAIKANCHIPYSSDSFNLLQESAKKGFKEKLENIAAKDLYFEYYEDKVLKERIENMFQMSRLVDKMKPNDRNELIINLKVQVEDQEAYSDWKIEEALIDIYHRNTGLPDLEFERFDLDSLPQSFPQLSIEKLNKIVEQLADRKLVFKDISNEATAHEFISVFLVNAVKFIIENNDCAATLKAEINLMGTHEYDPLDYAVLLQRFFILIVTKVKSSQTIQKGIAQNLAQIHNATKILGKQKIYQTDTIEATPMIGIITDAKTWVFIRKTGSTESAKLEKSEEFNCSFEGNMENEKIVVKNIVRVLQAQAKALKKLIKI